MRKSPMGSGNNHLIFYPCFHTLTKEKTRILAPLVLVRVWDLITNYVLPRFLLMKRNLQDKATLKCNYQRNSMNNFEMPHKKALLC